MLCKFSDQCLGSKLTKLLHGSLLLILPLFPVQITNIVEPVFMAMQSISLFESLILRVKSIPSSTT